MTGITGSIENVILSKELYRSWPIQQNAQKSKEALMKFALTIILVLFSTASFAKTLRIYNLSSFTIFLESSHRTGNQDQGVMTINLTPSETTLVTIPDSVDSSVFKGMSLYFGNVVSFFSCSYNWNESGNPNAAELWISHGTVQECVVYPAN